GRGQGAGEIAPRHHQGDHRQDGERRYLELPGQVDEQHQAGKDNGGRPEPEKEHARDQQLHDEQGSGHDPPGPVAQQVEKVWQLSHLPPRHKSLRTLGTRLPLPWPAAPFAGAPPNASRAISATPATEPINDAVSIGRISTFWFFADASASIAATYLVATK